MQSVEGENFKVELKVPEFEELSFRQKLYTDPPTIGCFCCTINFSRDKWADWFDKWVKNPEKRFYAYIVDKETKQFVGDVNYHYDSHFNCYMIGVVILDEFRGRGFAQEGLKLLIQRAKKDKIDKLANLIPKDRESAIHIHKKLGFVEIFDEENENDVYLELNLE